MARVELLLKMQVHEMCVVLVVLVVPLMMSCCVLKQPTRLSFRSVLASVFEFLPCGQLWRRPNHCAKIPCPPCVRPDRAAVFRRRIVLIVVASPMFRSAAQDHVL